ncbi:helix-turn-helix domain-containing protein [Rossellomorea sp. NRS-1567]|uniref:helix-turn-helix domain-containing protein n=1 Tax=Rossellomorea sp. NRS-1567 TaxID=3233901 RepID=UPI003D2E2FBA
MGEVDFKLRGKVIRMARQMKNLSIQELAEITGIYHNTIAMIEREERGLSRLNEIRILRGLRQYKVTDIQLASIQLIVEHDEGKFDEE